MLVSWVAQRPLWAALVAPESSTTLAPSQRAAVTPVNTFNVPGPVVAKTTVGRRVAKWASVAAKAAPVSWRKWHSVIDSFSTSASNKRAIAPPLTPKACRTPRSARWRTRAETTEASRVSSSGSGDTMGAIRGSARLLMVSSSSLLTTRPERIPTVRSKFFW